jgi:hypothetical protein
MELIYICITKRFGMGRLSKAASTPHVEAILAADCCVKDALKPVMYCSAVRDSVCDQSLG